MKFKFTRIVGGNVMKERIGVTLGLIGALTLSIGFANALQQTDVSEEVITKQGDIYKHVTREEQDLIEGKITEGKDMNTVITVEEQEKVENTLDQQGFVSQENGTGFFFEKEQW